MNPTEGNFALYLCNTDIPVKPDNTDKITINRSYISSILKNNDIIEEVLDGGLEAVIEKKLALNPFLNEDTRSEIFEKNLKTEYKSDFISEVCRESFLSRNTLDAFKNVVAKTTIVDWKAVKVDSLKRIHDKFIDKFTKTLDTSLRKDVSNKIFPNNS